MISAAPEQTTTPKSKEHFAQLEKLIPGGVNSPFRSFADVGGYPITIASGNGAHVTDIDGNEYIDYLGAWGPAVLGYCPPQVVAACKSAIELGAVFGAPHRLELEMARLLIDMIPTLEKVRFVNSGTEAVMSAVRLARGATGRNIIVMFEGGYHGHSDSLLASQTHSSSQGLLAPASNYTIAVPYNNVDALEECLKQNQDDLAAVVIEPVCGSMSVVLPEPGFLKAVEDLCRRYGALLIFDEVLTGFRIAAGGAQALYGVNPDLICYGKALGGGMPIGAYGGSATLMDKLQPLGRVYQAGTFSGNPVTMAAGVEILKLLGDKAVFERLEALTNRLQVGLESAVSKLGCPVRMQRAGSMFAVVFAPHKVVDYQSSLSIDSQAFARFFHHCLKNGVYLPPSAVDAACLSAAHNNQDIDRTVQVFSAALEDIYQ